MTTIALSRLHFPVTTLGPGQRVGIWFQGCSIRCPGCISVDTWPIGRGITSVSEVMRVLIPWLSKADGVTVSGGEPFDQPEALRELLDQIRNVAKVSVLVYSGYRRDQVAWWLDLCPGLVDGLMADPLDVTASQTLAFRGSDNQRLHLLTPLGLTAFKSMNRMLANDDRHLDAMFDSDGTVWFTGIPLRGDLGRLRAMLAAAGHRMSITEGEA